MLRRLADEYDAAQERGEIAQAGGDKSKLPEQNFATVTDIGLTHKDIHEARIIRDVCSELSTPSHTGNAILRRLKSRT